VRHFFKSSLPFGRLFLLEKFWLAGLRFALLNRTLSHQSLSLRVAKILSASGFKRDTANKTERHSPAGR
jgi:hypothetical protein